MAIDLEGDSLLSGDRSARQDIVRGVGAAVTKTSAPSPVELIVAAILALVVAVAALGSHAINGGFYLDDWTNYAVWRYSDGFGSAVETYSDREPSSNHLTVPLIFAVGFALFGGHMGFHLAGLIAVAALSSGALYAVVRACGGSVLVAGLLGVGVLLWPWADSTKLWTAAVPLQLSLALLLIGVALAVWSLRSTGVRRTGLLIASLAAYALAILTYELMAGGVVLALIVYLWVAPPREAFRRWPLDVAVAAVCMWFVMRHNPVSDVQGPKAMFEHGLEIADDGLTLLARTLWPFGQPSPWLVLVPAALMAIAGAVTYERSPPDGPDRRRLMGAGLLALTGLAAVAAGYSMVVPAEDYYRPLAPGSANRINVLAAVGFVAIAVGFGALLAALVRRRLGPVWAATAVLAVALALGAGYFDQLAEDKSAWDRAYVEEQRLIDLVRREVPEAPPGSTIYLFGHESEVAPGVQTFGWVWDLNGAVKLLYGDPSLSGLPVLPGTEFVCAADFMYPTLPGGGFGRYQGSPYTAIFVHVDGRSASVNTPGQCRRQAQRFLGQDAPA